MRAIGYLITGVIVVMCGCGAVLVHEPLSAMVGIDADDFTTDTDPAGFVCTAEQCPPGADWVAPVPHGVVSGYRTAERPDHQGVDLGSPKNTPVMATSAGTVLAAECSATLNGAFYGCDRDGSWQVSGCGWHVTIAHADNLMSVYCHFIQQPTVSAGDTVAAGDVIGTTGSSGNSSGPHLHLEIHSNHTWDRSSAIDPIGFYAARGITL